MLIRKIVTYCFLSVFLLLAGKTSFAQKYTEYELKSAFVYNFTKFINWPDEDKHKNETFKIVVFRNNTMKIVLNEMLRGKKIKGRIPEVIYVKDVSKIPDCQIIFIDDVTNSELIQILNKFHNKPCLTVGNHLQYFCQQGGIINFTPKYYNYRFEINNRQAEWVNIVISSKLLILSKLISPNENKF